MDKKLNVLGVYNFLGKSGDLSIAIIRTYISWVLNISGKADKRLILLSDFLGRLTKYLYDDYTMAITGKSSGNGA
jgi:hypothetical protein